MLTSGVTMLNPKAEYTRAAQSLAINVNAAKGLMEILRTSLGPSGTYKMLVSGSGDIKVTKDGNVLLGEMQIQHPTASLIARAATAQETVTGDGTTSIVLLIGELLKQADLYISEGLHPRVLHSGLHFVKPKVMEILEKLRIKLDSPVPKDMLLKVARTSLRTKVPLDLADHLTIIVVDAILAVGKDQKDIDLKMIEIMEMMHQSEAETRLVKGLVLDHGGRHPEMPRRLQNAYVLTCNVSMEFEKTEVNAGFFYKTAAEREKLVASERQYILSRVQKIVDLKKKLCPPGSNKGFLVVNQKGIDPFSLDLLAKNGILALRRAKRRNMERLTLACGGVALNSFDELDEKCLGFAGEVYEHVLGEDKYTFIEGCKGPRSVTILIKGPNKHTMSQIKDALRDGMKATLNAIEDGCVVPGAGAFEIACSQELLQFKAVTKGRARLAVQALADALLIIPKAIATNAGLDVQEVIVKLQDEYDHTKIPVGIDIDTGLPINPMDLGILDCFRVKRNIIYSSITIASSILLVDEILRAGVSLKNTKAGPS